MIFMGYIAYHLFQNSLDQKSAKSPWQSSFNLGLKRISRSRFNQSKNPILISQSYV